MKISGHRLRNRLKNLLQVPLRGARPLLKRAHAWWSRSLARGFPCRAEAAASPHPPSPAPAEVNFPEPRTLATVEVAEIAGLQVGIPPVAQDFFVLPPARAPQGPGRTTSLALLDDDLGQLPDHHGSGRILLLPRDPTTLFVSPDLAWNEHGRTLELFEDGRSVRQMELPASTPALVLRELQPGSRYRVEVFGAGPGGARGPLAGATDEVQLPPAGPSSDVSVQTAVIPWTQPLVGAAFKVTSSSPRTLPDAGRAQPGLTSSWGGQPLDRNGRPAAAAPDLPPTRWPRPRSGTG